MKTTRREFLLKGSALSLSVGALPWAMNLAAIGEASAQTAPADYKALVCIFLAGGNDHANTLIPLTLSSDGVAALDPNYVKHRGDVGFKDVNDLAATRLTPDAPLPEGRAFALAPNLKPLVDYFNGSNDKPKVLAVLLNVGTLITPTTKADYTQGLIGGHPLPPQLFSHNDQTSLWQSAALPEGATAGWGGRICDALINTIATPDTYNGLTSISLSGNSVFLAGNTIQQLSMLPTGPVPVSAIVNSDYAFGSSVVSGALAQIMASSGPNMLEQDYAAINKRALGAADILNAKAPFNFDVEMSDPKVKPLYDVGGTLVEQLRMVAHLIKNRDALGAKRQVFFVTLGGFDTHSGLLTAHAALMAQVGTAMAAFHEALVKLGVDEQVTTFTASEFGRTLSNNGDGSDHGWGSVHFVMGGAVQGGRLYGKAPKFAIPGDDEVGQGRLLPSTPMDMYAATLARWMGITDPAALESLLPNLGNFRDEYEASNYNLGFLG